MTPETETETVPWSPEAIPPLPEIVGREVSTVAPVAWSARPEARKTTSGATSAGSVIRSRARSAVA